MLHCTDVFSVFSDGKEPTGSYTLHPHYGAILEKPSVNNYIGFFLWSFKVNRIQGAALCQECCTNEDKLYSNQVSPLLIPCYSALFFSPSPPLFVQFKVAEETWGGVFFFWCLLFILSSLFCLWCDGGC